MDPNAALGLMLDAMDEDRWEDAAEHAGNLNNWMAKGGFAPARMDRKEWRSLLESFIRLEKRYEKK